MPQQKVTTFGAELQDNGRLEELVAEACGNAQAHSGAATDEGESVPNPAKAKPDRIVLVQL